jgi:hypothetical protein
VSFHITLLAPIMISEFVVVDGDVHAFVVLPYFTGSALDPGSFGCEVVVAADAAAGFVVFVVVVEIFWLLETYAFIFALGEVAAFCHVLD